MTGAIVQHRDPADLPAERSAAPPTTLAQDDPAALIVTAPKSATLMLPEPASGAMRLRSEKIEEIARAIHQIAGDGLHVTVKQVVASLGNETRRINFLSSALLSHKWLGELLETANAPFQNHPDDSGSGWCR